MKNPDILIVDDKPANLKLLTSILNANGYSVRAAPSGKLAIRSLESKVPKLILLDIKMPEMDGFEVCKILKSNENTANIPVIFISAMDSLEDKIKAFETGAIDYITKPFESKEVLIRVNTHLKIDNLQKELQNQNRKLKATISKLLEKERMLIEQSKMAAMGQMISAIAHQWRQPLNALALLIQNFEISYEYDNLTPERVERIVKSSMEQIEFMSDTIDNFRNYFSPNKMREEFDILESINKTLSILISQFKNHNIEIKIEGESIAIYGYKNEFQQVILNLLNNAKDSIMEAQERDRNHKGEIKVSIFKDEDSIRVEVLDNGVGISPDIIESIYEPYFTTKFPNKGTGIGLYMVKEIVEKHYRGSVNLISSEGDGAKFIVDFPLSNSKEDI